MLFSFCIRLIPFFLMVLLIMLSCFPFSFVCFGNMLKSDCRIGDPPPLGFAPNPCLKIHVCVLPSCQVRFPICMEPRFYGPSLCRCTLLGHWKLCPFRGHLLSGPMTLLPQMALFTVISMMLYIINGEKLKPTCGTDSINF